MDLLPFGQSEISSDSYTKVWSGVAGGLTIGLAMLLYGVQTIVCTPERSGNS